LLWLEWLFTKTPMLAMIMTAR